MKDWVIIVIAIVAFMYISGSASAAINALARAVGDLAEKMEEMNDKIDALAEKVDDVEDEVSGRAKKRREARRERLGI